MTVQSCEPAVRRHTHPACQHHCGAQAALQADAFPRNRSLRPPASYTGEQRRWCTDSTLRILSYLAAATVSAAQQRSIDRRRMHQRARRDSASRITYGVCNQICSIRSGPSRACAADRQATIWKTLALLYWLSCDAVDGTGAEHCSPAVLTAWPCPTATFCQCLCRQQAKL